MSSHGRSGKSSFLMPSDLSSSDCCSHLGRMEDLSFLFLHLTLTPPFKKKINLFIKMQCNGREKSNITQKVIRILTFYSMNLCFNDSSVLQVFLNHTNSKTIHLHSVFMILQCYFQSDCRMEIIQEYSSQSCSHS